MIPAGCGLLLLPLLLLFATFVTFGIIGLAATVDEFLSFGNQARCWLIETQSQMKV